MNKFNIIKSALILTILLGLVTSSASEVAHDTHSNNLNYDASRPAQTIVKGMLDEGTIVPLIDLPTVEITASIPDEHLVPAEKIDGVWVPSITLGEVVISPNTLLQLVSK